MLNEKDNIYGIGNANSSCADIYKYIRISHQCDVNFYPK